MQREHARDLCRLGYSAQEAFWLDFACLPFLPWDGTVDSEMPLSCILRLYADVYRSTVGSSGPWNEAAFVELLRRRYYGMRQLVAATQEVSSGVPDGHTPAPAEAGPAKWALGGLIVLQTARAWQAHRTRFPCRLVENL
jgi:hypothetical protein